MRNPSNRPLRSEGGFTLVELLVVIVILGILIAIAVPTFLNQQDKAKDASAQTALNTTYKVAKSIAVDYDGKFVGGQKADGTGVYDAAELANDLHASEPELTVTTSADTAADIDHSTLTAGTVYITADTDGSDLEAVAKSDSGSLCTLKVENEALEPISCAPASATPADPVPAALTAMSLTSSFLPPAGMQSQNANQASWSGAGGLSTSGTSGVFFNTASRLGYGFNSGGGANYLSTSQFDGSGATGDAVQFTLTVAPSQGQSVCEYLNLSTVPKDTTKSQLNGYMLCAKASAVPGQYTVTADKILGPTSIANAYTGTVPLTASLTGSGASTLALVYKAGTLSAYVGTDGAAFHRLGNWTDTGQPNTHGYVAVGATSPSSTVDNFKAGSLPG